MADVLIRNISKAFGAAAALTDVSIDVADGSFHALLGPSGCGKTTLLRLIAGFERSDKGAISIGGAPIDAAPPEKRDIGMVFQNYALFPNMSVRENIGFGLNVRRISRSERRRRIDDALDLVRLSGLDSRRPHQLSGGQRQRVALARAIVIQPRVLLLDEPLSALDKALRVDMQVELKRIQREVGVTTLFVTHDQEEALTLSDRISILNTGALVQEGAPRDVYDRPESAFTAKFLGDANIFSGVYDAGAFVLEDGSRLRVANPPSDMAPKFKVAVRSEKIKLASLDAPKREEDSSLEVVVESHMFAGASITYRLSWGENLIKVIRQNDEAIFEPGDMVRAVWSPEHTILVTP